MPDDFLRTSLNLAKTNLGPLKFSCTERFHHPFSSTCYVKPHRHIYWMKFGNFLISHRAGRSFGRARGPIKANVHGVWAIKSDWSKTWFNSRKRWFSSLSRINVKRIRTVPMLTSSFDQHIFCINLKITIFLSSTTNQEKSMKIKLHSFFSKNERKYFVREIQRVCVGVCVYVSNQ